jgi:hypothetical protein
MDQALREDSMPGVSGYLVTGRNPHLTEYVVSTSHFANWLEGRVPRRAAVAEYIEGEGDMTCHVMVPDDHAEAFLVIGRNLNDLPRKDRVRTLTVERINGSGEDETYELLVGEPGSGWLQDLLLFCGPEHQKPSPRGGD